MLLTCTAAIITTSEAMRMAAASLKSTAALVIMVGFLSAASAAYVDSGWQPASATWYGSPAGAGSDGGACGYGSLENTPYGFSISSGSPVLFQGGKGCGTCYQIKCVEESSLCSTNPVTVVITDECPGCGGTHFDMSGFAFSSMSRDPSLKQLLLNVGMMNVLYRRVQCAYPRINVAFQVDQGATNYWFAILIKYIADDGDCSKVEFLQGAPNSRWLQMQQLWGATWFVNGGPLVGPFSIRITSAKGSTIVADKVIPPNWSPGSLYTSHVNFA
ncbi:hypothetical protein L7F22_030304 [Adiantum nelumboides]|nr:hypothetical protein [Adiantum nelumboides]